MPIVVTNEESKVANNVAQAHLEVASAQYKAEADKHYHKKAFVEGYLVMVYMQRSCFLSIHTKLEKRKYRPFWVAWKINDNAYVL